MEHDSFSRDIATRDLDGRKPPEASSSEESSDDDEEEEDEAAPRIQPGDLPPNSDSDDDDDQLTKPMNRQLNLGNSKADAPPPKSAEEIAAARKARRGKGKPATSNQKGGSDDDGEDNSEDEDMANANRKKTTGKLSDLAAPREMSRREREQAEKAAARERYMKMHLAGKTDEAKADLNRLAQIRKQREAAAAARKAEAEAKEAVQKAALEKSGKKGQR